MTLTSASDLLKACADLAALADGVPNVETESSDQVFSECPEHGSYWVARRDERGVWRYRPKVCPVCLARKQSELLMRSAAIPKRHQHCTFDNYRAETKAQKGVLQACRDYAANFDEAKRTGACLILSGLPGTGKNHLATAIAREVLAAGNTVLFCTAYDIVSRVREGWNQSPEFNGRKPVEDFVAADLLIIDEVGRQYGSKSEEVILFEIINRRHLDMRPMIVLSNETVEGIESYLGSAAFDRLCEQGTLLRFHWESARRSR